MKQIIVTGKNFGPVSSLEDLSGKKVFVNSVTTYYENLEKVNDALRKQGKPTILIQSTGKNLLDEDLLEMVNAGILPATVTITQARQALGQRVSRHHSAAQYRRRRRRKPGVGDAQEQSEVQRVGE